MMNISSATSINAFSNAPSTLATPTDNLDTAVTAKRPPTITTSITEEYIQACARSNQKASLLDPLTTLFQAEKLPPLPNEETSTNPQGHTQPTSKALRARLSQLTSTQIEQMIYESSIARVHIKAQSGAFIVEAGNWAATTCWEPIFAPPPPSDFDSSNEFTETEDSKTNHLIYHAQPIAEIATSKPLFADFLTKIELAKQRHLYPVLWRAKLSRNELDVRDEYTKRALSASPESDERLLYWKLCLTSRNPAVQPPVAGAVRAIIEPFVRRWVDGDGMAAVWLEAGSPRARDVYSYLGFRVVGEISVAEDEEGKSVKTWLMMYTKD